MTAYDPARWSEFALGQLGASAALLGLVFVGLSINLRELIRSRPLVNRGAETVVALGSVLVAATVVLIPHQTRALLGAELLAVAACTLGVVAALQRRAAADAPAAGGQAPRGSLAFRRALGLGAPLVLAVAGATLLAHGGGGLYWWPASVVALFVAALTNAWVLLVEILR